MDREGEIPSLETLILHRHLDLDLDSDGFIPDSAPLDFLKKNPQLKALAFHSPETSTLAERALSILATFPQLKRLSMSWDEVDIPDSSFDALSSLSSLEVLHLRIGSSSIRHNTIINHLRPLGELRRIAFSHDAYSYPSEGELIEYDDYSELRNKAWGLHQANMRGKARRYAKAFPNLEFIHVGQISFEINREKRRIKLEATEDEEFSWEPSMFDISEGPILY